MASMQHRLLLQISNIWRKEKHLPVFRRNSLADMNVLNRYRDNHSSSDDDSEDSDKECTVWKRATTAKRKIEPESLPDDINKEINEESSKPKRKVNTIWTEILQDQLISDDLEDCLLKNKPAHYDSRGKESYDYTLKYSDPRVKDDIEDSPMEEESFDKSKIHDPKNKFNTKKFVKLDGAEQSAARKIIKVLNEKKVYLIQRIVKYVGVEKALTLLSMTEEIEENGGMMINNNARRRTPGGVYLQLLKADKDVTKEMLDKIFEGEMNCVQLKQYYAEKKKKKKQFLKHKKERKIIEKVEMLKNEPCDTKMDEETNSNDLILQSPVPMNNSIQIPVKTKESSENISDLEEGEIDD